MSTFVHRLAAGWLAIVGTVGLMGCGANTADLVEGSSGLSGAIPGGDGRALAGYKAEFTADALMGIDSLMLRLNAVWQGDDRDVLADLYADDATFVTPDGHLLHGGENIRAFVSDEMPRISQVETWRDDFAASGLMAYVYGRYETDASRAADDHRGVHITIAKRDRFTWRIRSKSYLAFDGAGQPLAAGLVGTDPPHVTPESIRESFGRRGVRGLDERAEWLVSSYFFMNSYLAQWRYSWNGDDFSTAVDMMGRDVVLRLPWDVPAVGKVNAAYSLERLLPAVGDLQMSILDFDASERISYALGAYELSAGGQLLTGYFTTVVQMQDDGPELRALIFSGAGANEVPTERLGRPTG